MKYSIVIIFITIQLFNGIQSNDAPSKVHPCDLVRCFSATNCPKGTHLQVANRDEGHCCNTCVPAAKLDEKCGVDPGTTLCLPNLMCSYENDSYNSTVCAYSWETNFLPNICDLTYCPTYKSCPKNTFLIPNNYTENTCCEKCVPYAMYGDYCDEKQLCLQELKCKNNICVESDACANQTKECPIISSCPNNTYFLQGDGLTRCCDACLKFDDGDNRRKREVNCEGIQCSMPRCGDGYKLVYPDRKEACCPYCEKVANNRRKRALNCDGIQCSPVKCENGFVEVFNKEKQCCPSCEKVPDTGSVISRLG